MMGAATVASVGAKLLKLGSMLLPGDSGTARRIAMVLAPAAAVITGLMFIRSEIKSAYEQGLSTGTSMCTATVTARAADARASAVISSAASAASQATADIHRATVTGTAHEATRQRVAQHFTVLEAQAHHAPQDPVDHCVLPPERLRIWAAANAGPHGGDASTPDPADQGAPAAQPAHAPAGAASTSFWPRARLGGQPPASSPGLSPDGLTALPAAGLH